MNIAQYDGAGRPVVQYVSDGGGDQSWADAGNVAGDNVLSQVETQYDADSQPIATTTRERDHNETSMGALGNATTTPKARVSYVAQYYDSAERPLASADFGTNGGAAWTRPSTVPASSATVLVSSQTYAPAGWIATQTDARGIVTQDTSDRGKT